MSGKLEKAKAEFKARRYHSRYPLLLNGVLYVDQPSPVNPDSLDKKDTQGFDFTYAIPLLIAVLTVLLLSGILFRAIILSGMFLCALLVLREGIEHSGYKATLDDKDEDQTRDLKIEIERLTQKHNRNVSYLPPTGIAFL